MSATLVLDGRVLQSNSATRGIGTYLRGLLGGLGELGELERVHLLVQAGRAVPPEIGESSSGPRLGPSIPVVKRRLQPLLDPVLVRIALSRVRQPLLYHAIEYAQPVLPRCPVVVTIHDLIPFLLGDGYRWMRRERALALRQLRRADAVIAVSESTADDAVRLAGVDRARIAVIHHGVNAAFAPAPAEHISAVRRRLGLGPHEPFVLSVGTFDDHKRLPLLIDAVRAIRREHPDIRLVCAGDQGGYAARVRDTIRSAGLVDTAVLAGHVATDDLVALYSDTTCLLFTSAYEGFGLPLLEAMACGAPVAAFSNSAIPEVAGSAGMLVADGDAAAMAAAVAHVVEMPGERARRVAAGRAHAATFTWRGSAAAHVDVYRRLGG